MTDSSFSRREFLQLTASAAAMLGLTGCAGLTITPHPVVRKPRPLAPGGKIRIAQIGFAGKGSSDIQNAAGTELAEVVALCDVDWSQKAVQSIFKKFPNAKQYKDFRKMLIEMDDQIDAVGVATPDHMHFLPAYMAMSMGKHVYVQKPLTQTVWEADQLLQMARATGVCTQMGNQGHAGEGCRLVREWISAGIIGPVHEVKIWTNRPIWPQGITRPATQEPPKDMDWDLWLGRAPKKGFSPEIHPFKWRGYLDYGGGALADMGCHIMDAAFWSLDLHLVDPLSIEATTEGLTADCYPNKSTVTYKFPARGAMPPLTLTWQDGGLMPEKPKQLEANRQLAKGGQMIIGEKATIYDANDYCNSPRIIPEALMQEIKPQRVPKTIPRVPKNDPHLEWLTGITKGNPHYAGSNFEYSVPLTKLVVLGNLAVLTGKKIEWNGKKLMCTNVAEANQYVKPAFRAGWSPAETVKKA